LKFQTSNLVGKVDSSKSQPKDNKTSLKGAWSGHANHLNCGGTDHISGVVEARVFKFCTPIGCIKSQHMVDKSPLKGAWSWSHDTFFKILPQLYLWKWWR